MNEATIAPRRLWKLVRAAYLNDASATAELKSWAAASPAEAERQAHRDSRLRAAQPRRHWRRLGPQFQPQTALYLAALCGRLH